MKTVSVVVPCRNEEKHIRNCILSLAGNATPEFAVEILIVDGMSTDGTRAIVNELIADGVNVRLIDNPRFVTPVALNLGVQNASGEYVMIASAHSSFSTDYIPVLAAALERLNADGVGGFMKTVLLHETPKSLAIKQVMSCRFGVGNSIFRVGADEEKLVDTVPFGLYRKELFEEIGGYDERLIRNHDIELSKRFLAAKKKIYLIPQATCNYFVRETYSQIAKNNYQNGLWNILTVKITKDFSSLSIRHFVPLVFLLSLLLPAIAACFYWPLIFISLLSLIVYLGAMMAVGMKLAHTHKCNFFYLMGAFLTLHFSYACGSLVGIFKPVHRER